MSDFAPTNLHQTLSVRPVASATASTPMAAPARRVRRLAVGTRRGRAAAAALMSAVMALSVSVASSASATASPVVGPSASASGASNARSAPAQGGALGTVDSVSKSNFTMTTSTGQKVTVDEKSSTTYKKGTSSTSAKVVTKGQSVLALGTVNSTTVAATEVVIGYKSAASAKATTSVVPFKKGETTASKQVGQIPANWSAGQGTIVSGATANKATEAALAAYPGAIVDRVAKLSDGEYNVHYIGVNWPHHVFETAGFKVVGAL